MILESGWRECDLSDCIYITVPGTPLRLPIQRGAELVIQAFLRDLDQYIEPVMNSAGVGDEGSWTEDNSVYSSNHKGAVAVDYNWRDHPMGPDAIAGDPKAGWNGSVLINGNEVPAVQELLAWYEGMIWWGAMWNSPKDSMHFQIGYNTAGPANAPRVINFIQRKIRADGYSTYRRGGTSLGGTSVPVVAIPTDHGLTGRVLQTVWANPDVSLDRYNAQASELVKAFHYCDINTIDRRAMALAQLGTESAGGRYQEEIASGAAYEGRADLGNTQPGDGVRFKGRDYLQITGRHNYTELSKWAFARGIVDSPTYFVDNPGDLATDDFAFIGFAWYWSVARPQLNQLADARDIDGATRAVNGGLNGLESRKTYYARALAANDDLMDPTDLDELENLLMANAAYPSWSAYATPGEPDVPLVNMIRGIDAKTHEDLVEDAARHGDTDAIVRLARTAKGQGTIQTPYWISRATSILNEINAAHPEYITAATPGKA